MMVTALLRSVSSSSSSSLSSFNTYADNGTGMFHVNPARIRAIKDVARLKTANAKTDQNLPGHRHDGGEQAAYSPEGPPVLQTRHAIASITVPIILVLS
jgi:hypothetical protein